MAPDNLDGKGGTDGRPFEGATLRPHPIIRETMATGDMQKQCRTVAVQYDCSKIDSGLKNFHKSSMKHGSFRAFLF